MKCKRRGCQNEAAEGKDYCCAVCSRIDNQKEYNKIVKKRGGIVKKIIKKTIKKSTKKVEVVNKAKNNDKSEYKYLKDGVSYRGKLVCENFDNEKIECVMCYEQGLYFGKNCRKGGRNL